MSTLTLMILVLILSLLLGQPIFMALGISTCIALITTDVPLSMIPQTLFRGVDQFPLLAIPCFVLAGSIMEYCGVTRQIIDVDARAANEKVRRERALAGRDLDASAGLPRPAPLAAGVQGEIVVHGAAVVGLLPEHGKGEAGGDPDGLDRGGGVGRALGIQGGVGRGTDVDAGKLERATHAETDVREGSREHRPRLALYDRQRMGYHVVKAGQHGLLHEKIDAKGWPIDVRVGWHCSAVLQILQTWSEDKPDRAVESRIESGL